MRKRSEVRPAVPEVAPGERHPGVRLAQHAAVLRTLTVADLSFPTVPPADIVKVVPARGLTAGDRMKIIERLKNAGVRHVWFAPARGGSKALPDRAVQEAPRTAETLRQVVDALFGKAFSADRDKLRAVLDDALSRAGA